MDIDTKQALYNQRRLKQRTTDELIGITKGIIADNTLHESEISFLCSWLENNKHLADHFPYDILMARIDITLEDGVIDEEENKELLALLHELVGNDNVEEDCTNFSTTLPLTSPCPEILFPNMNFCFTGKFYYGERKKCIEHTKAYGANISDSITKKLNYLVIGGIGSSDWLHSSFGNKIIKATELNKVGSQIYIVTEQTWEKALTLGV